MEEASSLLLSMLIGALPLFLICAAGIMASIARWSRHPSISLLTLLGCVLILLTRIVLSLVTPWLPRYLMENGWGIQQVGLLSSAIVFLANITNAVAVGLLLRAAFAGREKKSFPEL